MSDGTLASAVALPDQDSLRQSPDFPAKRRKSSVSDHESKRRRLSQDAASPHSQRRRPSSPPERRPARQGGRDEDRKRGQRLFGALLGTLSQSSNTAAQKRRADIEKKQQDKLKSQADEYDELKKRQKERRDIIRRKEKPFYEREAMQTRHSNMLAMAHFLKTQSEPVLYYKPWQLRPGDEAVIQEQIEEAEATVARETADFEARYPPEAFIRDDPEPVSVSKDEQPVELPESAEQQPESRIDTTQSSGSGTNGQQEQRPNETTSTHIQAENDADSAKVEGVAPDAAGTAGHEQADAHRVAEDDGGEVVEDNEDTVIY